MVRRALRVLVTVVLSVTVGADVAWVALAPWSASMPSASSAVGTMSIACAYCVRISPLALIPLGPVDDERTADAATIGFALPAPEWRIADEGPAPGIGIESRRAAHPSRHRTCSCDDRPLLRNMMRGMRRAGALRMLSLQRAHTI